MSTQKFKDSLRIGVPDMVLLENYNSIEAFLDNLEQRFENDVIYTYIGQVLVSVNPYKPLPIYTEDYINDYQWKHLFETPPHIFAITDSAYQSMSEFRKDQCILISGESGSGKTEVSKKVLQYIAAASGHKTRVEGVKDKLVQSNPVLEAFGNAKTNRNDNSSRFGKYMDIIFDYSGEPIGGNITNYLLEKSRVVNHCTGERNFHIFYQLLHGLDEYLLESFSLTRNVQDYHYLRQENISEEVNKDKISYREMRNAMTTMELTDCEQLDIIKIVSGVLHLGNVCFADHGDTSVIKDDLGLQIASKLFTCSPSKLTKALMYRSIEAKGDVVLSSLNKDLSIYARDALAKAIYDRLFTWLVSRINKSLQPQMKQTDTAVIGILDIYGFEIFQKNGFEQFCINYCNEKLQQLFVELTLKSEQEEYMREGIEWENVQYFDNKVICNLIEERHKGIISLLDEECLRPGDTSDVTFLDKITEQLRGHKHFVSFHTADKDCKKIMSREEFQLIHYAGKVTYDVCGFMEKNNDPLFRDLTEVISSTGNKILQEIFPKINSDNKKRPETAISQFKNSLNQLMELLKTKEPSYIRCIKPNDFKSPDVFDKKLVQHQVVYLGLMESVRIRRAGFAYREITENFFQRYKSLCPYTWPHYLGDTKDGVRKLLNYLGYDDTEYRTGNTKIFIRYSKTLFEIEDLFQVKKHELAAKIQALWRGCVARKEFLKLRTTTIMLQAWIRRYLAKKELERRRRAAVTIRNFIKGFMTRRDSPNELNRRFILTAKIQYLLRLSRTLPTSILVNTWPVPPMVCREASQHLRKLHKRWLSRKYRMALGAERKRQLELKVLAQFLFKGKKKNYPGSVGCKFINNRLLSQQTCLLHKFLKNNLYSHENLMYCCEVGKYDRHGYKRRNRILAVTMKAVYLLKEESNCLKMKHRLPFNSVLSLDVTSEHDNLLLVRISPELKNDKGDLILEVPFLIECITIIISSISKGELLHINHLENGILMHNMIGRKPKKIDVVKAENDNAYIAKGENGNLIVFG